MVLLYRPDKYAFAGIIRRFIRLIFAYYLKTCEIDTLFAKNIIISETFIANVSSKVLKREIFWNSNIYSEESG